jgi:serine/threonine protein kinase
VKILDFGLASLTGRSKLTKTGTTMGTPAYMSPEQLEGKNVDRRADIWALGCVSYDMLTQKTPFEADYEQAIGYGILNEDPEPVTAKRAGLSPEIDCLLSKVLAKDRDERYQHADEMLADLRVLQKRSGAQKTPSGRSATAIDHGAGLLTTSVAIPRNRLRIERLLAVVMGLLLLAVSYVYFTAAPREAPAEQLVRRFSFPVEDVVEISPTISPDGRYVAYAVEEEDGRNI